MTFAKTAKTKRGFTIIELMISTVVFSLMLLICMNALVQISRSYYKGVTSTKTQQAARDIVDEISQGIQMTADVIYPSSGPVGPQVNAGSTPTDLAGATGVFCIGTTKYSYLIDRQVNSKPSSKALDKQVRHALLRSNTAGACSSTTAADDFMATDLAAGYKSLLGENMRISKFKVAPVPGTEDRLWNIEVAVVYGDEDLLRNENGRLVCGSGTATEFCAFSEVKTSIKRRISGVN